MAMEIGTMFLDTPFKDFWYMQFHITQIPEEIIQEYNLNDIFDKDMWLYVKIDKQCMDWKELANLLMINSKNT